MPGKNQPVEIAAENKVLVDPVLSNLPPFLIQEGGLNSGYMITQYTAAALVSENKILAHPASVDSIPTSANQEDHVSMGTIAAFKCSTIIKNVLDVLCIELLCASQGLDFIPAKPGKGVRKIHETIRDQIPTLTQDRIISEDIDIIRDLILKGVILDAVENEIGPLE